MNLRCGCVCVWGGGQERRQREKQLKRGNWKHVFQDAKRTGQHGLDPGPAKLPTDWCAKT